MESRVNSSPRGLLYHAAPGLSSVIMAKNEISPAGRGEGRSFKIRHVQAVAGAGELGELAVPEQVGFAEEQEGVVVLVEIAPVGQGEEGVALAVRVGDVLKQPQAVQNVVLHLLVVGQDVHIGEPQAGREALKVRVDALALFLGLDIYFLRQIHGTGADAHDGAIKILQQLPQADFLEEGVFGGYMAPGEDDEVTFGNQLPGILCVGSVQHLIGAEGDARLGEGNGGVHAKRTGQLVLLRVRGHKQGPGERGQGLTDLVDKLVFRVQNGPVSPVQIGAAGDKNVHGLSFLLKMHAGEIFRHKVHLGCLEGFSVQVVQGAGVGGKGEGEAVGVQRLVVPVKALVQFAVFPVSQQGMSGVGELGPDLVGPAGDQLALHQGQPIGAGQGPVVGLAGFGAGLGGIGDEHPVLFGIFK